MKHLKMGRSTYSLYENGLCKINLYKLEYICGVDLLTIFAKAEAIQKK